MALTQLQRIVSLEAWRKARADAKDTAVDGRLAKLEAQMVTVLAQPVVVPVVSGTAPAISNLGASQITSSSAFISWFTNIAASSEVEYGLTTAYGLSTSVDGNLIQSHGQTISGLVANTTYHCRAKSVSVAGKVSVSSDLSFTTLPDSQATYLDMILSRSGLLGAWLFGDDSGATFHDRTAAANDGTWTGTPTLTTASPIPGDPKTAVTLGTTDVGSIPHIAAYNRGNGPLSVEFWTNAHDNVTAHWMVTKSNLSSDGWAVRQSGSLVRLTDGAGTSNIRQTAAAAAGWHHFVFTRGSGVDGKVYLDGVDVTFASNSVTLSDSASALQVLVDGGIYGLAYYNRELTAAEAASSAGYTYGAVQPPTLPSLVGYGANALSTLSANVITVTNLNTSGAGSFAAAFAQLDAGTFEGTINFTAGLSGAIDLGATVQRLDARANFFIDGRGASITFVGAPLWFEGCHHYVICNVRHRGGWDGGQNADDFTNAGAAHDFAYINVSTSGAGDEGLSSTRGCYNYSLVDCLIGPNIVGHNFGSLNYGGPNGTNGPGSFIRTAFIGLEYRCPKVAFGNDVAPYTLDARAITYDCVNSISVNCVYGLTAEYGAKVNNTNPYTQGNTNPDGAQTNAQIGTFTVAGFAVVTALSSAAAAANAKINCGCLPHDAFDIALLAQIN
jgi:hypothetical protein